MRKTSSNQKVNDLKNYIEGQLKVTLPLYSHKVRAGQPTNSDSHVEAQIDIVQYIAPHPRQTFLVRAEGDSMIGAGIMEGALLVVEKQLPISDGKIVIAAINGELTVKRLSQKEGITKLVAENEAYTDIILDEYQSVIMLGVVSHVIHSF